MRARNASTGFRLGVSWFDVTWLDVTVLASFSVALSLGVIFPGIISSANAQDHEVLSATHRKDKLLNSPVPALPTPGVAGDVINGPVPHVGQAPLGCTVADIDETVYVIDLFSGTAYTYDLALNPIGSLASPSGAVTHTGIAWYPTDDSLYWVDVDSGNQC